jgi:hypothetical protein
LFFFLPLFSSQTTQWIFGYGSLISSTSRDSTYKTNLPWKIVRVFGIGRGWWAPGTVAAGWGGIIGQDQQQAPTFLGALFDNSSTINGLIFQVNDTSLAAFDKRELTGAGYNRISVPNNYIQTFDGVPLTNDDVVYFYNVIPELLSVPTKQSPIVTSYIDLILTACLDIDQALNQTDSYNFTNEFVATTVGWSEHWVNDRLLPRRPWIYQPKSTLIDTILAKYVNITLLAAISFDIPYLEEEDDQNTQQQLSDLKGNLTQALETIEELRQSILDLQKKSSSLIHTIPHIFLLATILLLYLTQ